MGAEDISFKMEGRPTWSAIEKEFARKQKEAREYYGHQEGYTGSWGDVDAPADKRTQIYRSRREAEEWCSRNVEKRDSVAVTYMVVERPKDTKAMAKIAERVTKMQEQLRAIQYAPISKAKKFVTCEGCGSKISTAHVHRHSCPVCGEGDLRSLTDQRAEKRLKERIAADQLKLDGLRNKALDKAADKCKTYATLIYGVAPC